MTDKEKIRQEIERLEEFQQDIYKGKATRVAWESGKSFALMEISLFLDSLPEEPVSKDLEEEINKFVDIPENQGNPDLKEELSKCAHHFAQWQEQQDEKDTSDMLTVVYLRGADEGKRVMVDKACEWLDGVIWDYIDLSNVPVNTYINIDGNKFLQDFRKAMER